MQRNSAGTQTAAWNYAYDLAANRTNATIGGASHTFGYNAANQLISRNGNTGGWSYDANGNETSAVGSSSRTAVLNAKDQTTSFTAGGSSYQQTYLGAGQKERALSGGTTFASSPTGLVRTSKNGSIADYVRDPGGTLVALRHNGASNYFLFDGLGSIIGLVNANGTKVNSYSYDPYGVRLAATEGVPNSFQFTAGHLDSTTGLYKLGIRYYDLPSAASPSSIPPARTPTTPTPGTTRATIPTPAEQSLALNSTLRRVFCSDIRLPLSRFFL